MSTSNLSLKLGDWFHITSEKEKVVRHCYFCVALGPIGNFYKVFDIAANEYTLLGTSLAPMDHLDVVNFTLPFFDLETDSLEIVSREDVKKKYNAQTINTVYRTAIHWLRREAQIKEGLGSLYHPCPGQEHKLAIASTLKPS